MWNDCRLSIVDYLEGPRIQAACELDDGEACKAFACDSHDHTHSKQKPNNQENANNYDNFFCRISAGLALSRGAAVDVPNPAKDNSNGFTTSVSSVQPTTTGTQKYVRECRCNLHASTAERATSAFRAKNCVGVAAGTLGRERSILEGILAPACEIVGVNSFNGQPAASTRGVVGADERRPLASAARTLEDVFGERVPRAIRPDVTAAAAVNECPGCSRQHGSMLATRRGSHQNPLAGIGAKSAPLQIANSGHFVAVVVLRIAFSDKSNVRLGR